MSHACQRFWNCYLLQNPWQGAHSWQGAQSLAPSMQNDIWRSKSFPNMWCFSHLCFAPQRRALFRHLNFQKWSEREMLSTIWFPNVLHAARRAMFSSLIWSDGSAPFSKPTFPPSGATNHWKNIMFHDFSTLSRACMFFLLALSLLGSSLFFSLLLFSSLFFSLLLCSSLFFSLLLSSSLFFSSLLFSSLLFSSLLFSSRLFSSLLVSSLLFSSLLVSSLLFSSLLVSSRLFSSLLFSSFLFAGSSHLCFSICPYCRKFDF